MALLGVSSTKVVQLLKCKRSILKKTLITRNEFLFPSDHFLHNFTLDNSNLICQSVMRQNLFHNTEFIFQSIFEKSSSTVVLKCLIVFGVTFFSLLVF